MANVSSSLTYLHMSKSNRELLGELGSVLKSSKKQVPMSYFDKEDELLQKRIDESEAFAKSMEISEEKLNAKFTL